MQKYGFYIIDDEFYKRYSDPYLKGNKTENRPHYYCFADDEYNGIYWVIPMSQRVEKFTAIIERKKKAHKPCDILHICKLSNDKVNAFLIQDMFPIIDKYIKRPYLFAGNPLVLVSEKEQLIIQHKAIRIKNLIERGVKFTPLQVNALVIKQGLIQELHEEKCNK